MQGSPSNRLKSLVIAGLVAIWGCAAPASNIRADDGPPRLDGVVGQFTLIRPLRPAPPLPLEDDEGGTVTLARYQGKVVLVNFWATWCGPCVREMPSLSRLAAAMPRDKFVVAALSIDRQGFAVVTPFLKRLGIANLDVFIDQRSRLYRALGGQGLPTTFVIDKRGLVRGYLVGPAAWDSKAAQAFIRYFIDEGPQKAAR